MLNVQGSDLAVCLPLIFLQNTVLSPLKLATSHTIVSVLPTVAMYVRLVASGSSPDEGMSDSNSAPKYQMCICIFEEKSITY